MRKPQVRHTPHRKADERNEAERPQDQKRHDVCIRISHKKLRLEAGEGEHEGSRNADGQHLGDIGSATDTTHRIKERGKQASQRSLCLFLFFRFDSCLIRKRFRCLAVHESDREALVPLRRACHKDRGHGICENIHRA